MSIRLPLLVAVLLALAALNARAAKPQSQMTPEEVRALVYKPWHGVLLDLAKDLKPGHNYVAWMLVPPHYPLDMRSANLFKRSYLATPPDDFSISHNMILFQCTRKDGTHAEGGIAITGENDDQDQTMLKTGLGLTSLFSNFTDGELEGTDDVLDEIKDERQYNGQAIVAFEVSGDDCENMLRFVDAFSLDPKRPYRNFSNVKDPAKFEGGGCVTLAGTLLQKAGLLTDLLPHYWRSFEVNRHLLGGNIPLPKNTEAPSWPWLGGRAHHVPELELLAGSWDAHFAGEAQPLRLMDPEMMLYSLRTLAVQYLQTVPADQRAREERIYGHSAFGFRQVWSASDPFISLKDKYIKDHKLIPINDSFDAQTAQVSRAARAWYKQAAQDGLRARHARVGKSPALIFDRE